MWFSFNENMFILGLFYLSLSLLKMVGFRDYFLLLLCDFLLVLFVFVFNFFGMWEIDSVSCFCMYYIRIFLVILL